jgi:hypothetical protein
VKAPRARKKRGCKGGRGVLYRLKKGYLGFSSFCPMSYYDNYECEEICKQTGARDRCGASLRGEGRRMIEVKTRVPGEEGDLVFSDSCSVRAREMCEDAC